MKRYQVDLYDFCNNRMKDALKVFCSRINQSNADVFLLMAHKAVLLYYVLVAQGHINEWAAKKVVITNQSLDFGTHSLKGKKIAILEDIVISGTSIASTVNKLLSFGVSQDDIEVIAIAFDQDYFAMSFENTKGVSAFHCDCQMDDASCIELSAIISKVFSYYGTPYDVDFPAYGEFSISAEELNALHNNLLWDIVDVSNANHKLGGITAYTLWPSRSVKSRLWTALGVELEDCTELKIRLYITQHPNGFLECCVLPMCLFKEISVDNLHRLYDLLKPVDQTAFLAQNTSCVAQMRYLEFFISHQLYLVFTNLSSLGRGIVLEERIVRLLFGSDDSETVYHHLNEFSSRTGDSPLVHIDRKHIVHSSVIDEYKETSAYKKSCTEGTNWMTGNAYELGCWINQFIFTSFLGWYEKKEVDIRNKLKQKALHYVKDREEIEQYLFRLRNGLPMSALKQILRERVSRLSDQEAEKTISLFVDRAIDEGIIVPTIYYNTAEGYLCHAYRHGEDLPFGETDQYRLVYFLYQIGKNICKKGSDGEGFQIPAVAEISLEKMIVLFYQMGMRQGNIFNRFLGFNNIDIIHSFLSVHGTIQGYTNCDITPHIYSERDSAGNRYITWLTTWLYEANLIGRNPEGVGMSQSNYAIPINLDKIERYLQDNDRSTISPDVKESIEVLAELIAVWYNDMAEKGLKDEFKDDICALTSCANRYVFASAIATEIHYFSTYWNKQAKYALEETHDSQRLVDRLTDTEENQKYTDIIIQGLHSGREKVDWRNDHRAQNVIEKVKELLGPARASIWTKLWSGVDANSDPSMEIGELKTQTSRAVGLLYFFSICFECLKSTDFWDYGTLPRNFNSYMRKYSTLIEYTDGLDDSLFDDLRKRAKRNEHNLGKKIDQFRQLVRDGLYISKRCVNKIEEQVQKSDPIYTVKYQSALVLDISALDSEAVNDAFMKFWEQATEDSVKVELNLIRFPSELNHDSYVKYGIFFGQEEPTRSLDTEVDYVKNESVKRGEFLYTVFQRICSLLNGRLCQIRGVLVPHIIPSREFRHNLQRNIEENIKEFYESIKPLEVYYGNQWQMQLVLGLDRQVDQQFRNLFAEWNIWEVGQTVPEAEWVETCIVCGKDCIKLNEDSSNLMNRVAYSQLKVNCGENSGLGILLRTSNQVVCVSCNHIFAGDSKENLAAAVSNYNPNYHFDLTPLGKIHSYPDDKNLLLDAAEEVLVLEPRWEKDIIPFEIAHLLSIEDLGDLSCDISLRECMFYGCNDQGQMKWIDSIQVMGPIGQGYYQIGGEIEKIQSGCSGGIYVMSDSQTGRQIIGIHDGRFDENEEARMIPSSVIKTALEKITEGSITNGKST